MNKSTYEMKSKGVSHVTVSRFRRILPQVQMWISLFHNFAPIEVDDSILMIFFEHSVYERDQKC